MWVWWMREWILNLNTYGNTSSVLVWSIVSYTKYHPYLDLKIVTLFKRIVEIYSINIFYLNFYKNYILHTKIICLLNLCNKFKEQVLWLFLYKFWLNMLISDIFHAFFLTIWFSSKFNYMYNIISLGDKNQYKIYCCMFIGTP